MNPIMVPHIIINCVQPNNHLDVMEFPMECIAAAIDVFVEAYAEFPSRSSDVSGDWIEGDE